VSCQGSVPQAITAFLESVSVEDAIRKAVSLGGDSDTLACIAGSIAEACFGGLPGDMLQKVRQKLTPDLLQVGDRFYSLFGINPQSKT
jgi:ADP-ribosylglycohydrolase